MFLNNFVKKQKAIINWHPVSNGVGIHFLEMISIASFFERTIRVSAETTSWFWCRQRLLAV